MCKSRYFGGNGPKGSTNPANFVKNIHTKTTDFFVLIGKVNIMACLELLELHRREYFSNKFFNLGWG